MSRRALDLLTIKNKKSLPDGKVDFLSKQIVIKNKKDISIIDHIYITEDLVGRMDNICQHYYGTTDVLDLFLKFNEIDDPFAVPIGKHLLIPDRNELKNACVIIDLDNIKSLNSNELSTIDLNETATQTRTKLKNRNAFTVVANGVLKF